jgi:hypothetical protein
MEEVTAICHICHEVPDDMSDFTWRWGKSSVDGAKKTSVEAE